MRFLSGLLRVEIPACWRRHAAVTVWLPLHWIAPIQHEVSVVRWHLARWLCLHTLPRDVRVADQDEPPRPICCTRKPDARGGRHQRRSRETGGLADPQRGAQEIGAIVL